MKIKISQLKQIIKEELNAISDINSSIEDDLNKLLKAYLVHVDAEQNARNYSSYPIGGYTALDKLKNEFGALKQRFIEKYGQNENQNRTT